MVQRYQCKSCGKRFCARTGFNGLKYTAGIVTTALDLYFKGLSLRSIADHINQIQGYRLSYLTVYRWTQKYGRLIAQYTNRLEPKVSQKWHVDEMKVNVNGQSHNLWNLMDSKTRYLIATQVTVPRGAHEASCLLEKAIAQARGRLVLLSDGLPSYQSAVRRIEKAAPRLKIKHVADRGLVKGDSNNMVERLNGTVRQRVKTMRGLDNIKSSRAFAEGFAAYYNYIRPHMSLRGRTPSQLARTWEPEGTNRWKSLIKACSTRDSDK
jgi:transposase-like protein